MDAEIKYQNTFLKIIKVLTRYVGVPVARFRRLSLPKKAMAELNIEPTTLP